MADNIHAVQKGSYAPAIQSLEEDQTTNDHELYAAELGRVQQLAGEYQASSKTFLPLMTKVQQDQLQAKIRASHILANAGSLLSNDNALPYTLNGFQVVLLYQFQALNFIAEDDTSDALVSLRKSNNMQTVLQQEYQTELADAEAKIKKNKLDPKFMASLQKQMAATLSAGASVKSSFLNAMSYYLFALLSESTGDWNNAAAGLKQAIGIMPNNTYLQTALLQALQNQGASESIIQNYLTAFKMKAVPQAPPNTGTVVVWYDQRLMPPLQQFSTSIYLPLIAQTQKFSFPVYKAMSFSPTALEVTATAGDKKDQLPSTQMITNVYALAAKQLQENYPIIFLRESLRILAKAGVVGGLQAASQNNNQSQGQSNAEAFAAIAMQIYNILTSGADLRSWLTLPDNVQIAQYTLPSQTYDLTFTHINKSVTVKTPVNTSEITLIWVSEYGKQLKAKVFQLGNHPANSTNS